MTPDGLNALQNPLAIILIISMIVYTILKLIED